VNFVKCGSFCGCISKMPPVVGLFSTILVCLCLVGCSDEVTMPSAGQLMEFENAGPLRPTVDMNRLVRAKIGGGPYRVVNGDVLELTLPALLLAVTHEQAAGADKVAPYLCRIGDGGTVALPLVGEIEVTAKTLAQIESAVIDAYYPAYTVTPPYVFARVAEYRTAKVSITGAVNKPGIYSLSSDKMSLVALLMEAGGIADEGAALIRIVHADRGLVSDDQRAVEGVEESVGKLKESQRIPLLTLNTQDPPADLIEVDLAFEQSSPSSMAGKLKVTHGQTILLVERLDISNKEDRLLLLWKLERAEPRASIADADQKLWLLAEQLKRAARTNNKESRIPGSGTGSSPTPGDGLAGGRGAVGKNLAHGGPWLSGMNVQDRLWHEASPRTFSYDDAGRQDHVDDKTIHAATGFYADASNEGFAVDATVNPGLTPAYARATTGNGRITGPAIAERSQELVLPIKGLNIPFADVVLHDGDSVIVERLAEPLFSVMGLVNRAGNFPYPPDVQFNLMQALASAGGLNLAADPRYATVYRLKPDGTIVSAVFEVANVKKGSGLTAALNIHIKPGDIVAVEHTPRTRTKVFLDSVFRINIGTYMNLDNAWD